MRRRAPSRRSFRIHMRPTFRHRLRQLSLPTAWLLLLLERSPALTPDQVKGVLREATRRYSGQPDGAGVVDPVAAVGLVESGQITAANRGLLPSIGLPLAVASGEWGQFYWDQSYWQQFYWDDGGSLD